MLKEISKVVNGNSKLNFIYVGDGNQNKCESFINSMNEIRLPIIKNKKQKIELNTVSFREYSNYLKQVKETKEQQK